MKTIKLIALAFLLMPILLHGQRKKKMTKSSYETIDQDLYKSLKWRNIGPFRGGRSVTSTGVVGDPMTYYMGSTGGGVWKTSDAGISWNNVSDGFFELGSVGAIAVSESDPNVVYVGMGEHAVRGVMTSHGNGVYKSTDAGKTWKHIGLDKTMTISDVIIHPTNPEIVFISAQGAQHGKTVERGVYKSVNGGASWDKVLYVDDNVGASSLSMDMNNPRVLYASMWQHIRYPWTMESGGEGSGLYKSTDMGTTWDKMEEGLPEEFGKSGISASRANGNLVFAVIEAQGEEGGVYRSDDAGKTWKQINSNRMNIARSWYYMEIFADPQNENVVYVLNAPVLKSIDGGKSFAPIVVPHGDNHHLWINPKDNQNMVNSNDGGANVTFNGGKSWSSQKQQPTSQFYRVITDNLVPYNVYGGQQDNTAIAIASRTNRAGIGWKDWYSVAGCESAYLAFDPDNPQTVFGGCYQGIIEKWDKQTNERKEIKEYPELSLGNTPKNFKYRYNWNAPIISSVYDRSTIYHAGNVVFKTQDGGMNWETISPDLTRNDKSRQGPGGGPYTNEGAGGENYNTIMYLAESPHQQGVLWVGTDDGLVHITKDDGKNWQDVTPVGLPEAIVNSIEVSTHAPGTAYLAVTAYKFNDLSPMIYKTSDYGATWEKLVNGIDGQVFVRVVREDRKIQGLLYAGTEAGLYVSFNDGQYWQKMQLNLPVVAINDLTIQDNDLVAATAGRSFWILDDLGALQQTMGKFGKDSLAIYKPKDTYRLFGASNYQAVAGLGENPKQGVTFDYYLASDKDSAELVLKVIDAEGNAIREITNQKQEEFIPWQGGPQEPVVLTSKKGLNRFTWDFGRDDIASIDKVFVMGSYLGSRVGPGDYTLRLILESDSVQTKVRILPDPRIDATMAQYNEQQTVLLNISKMIQNIHESVNVMRTANNQLKTYKKLLENKEEAKVLLDTAESIIDKIEAWEKELIQPDQKTFQDVINFNNKLSAELMYLRGFIDSADPRVTSGAKERFSDLKKTWEDLLNQKKKIIDENMIEFERIYKSLNLPVVIVPEIGK